MYWTVAVTVQSNETRPIAGSLPATLSATCVLIGGAIVLSVHELGATSAHMAVHIGAMNVMAPLTAALIALRAPVRPSQPATVWAAAVVQVAMLWVSHAPIIQQQLSASHPIAIASHAALFLSALWFWWSLLRLAGSARWHGIGVLLVTGKLACLLGVLLTFAPRLLHEMHRPHETALSDQQLAGLLMITACPLSFLIAGVVLATQLIASPRPTWNTISARVVH
jgi:putative membrane protein